MPARGALSDHGVDAQQGRAVHHRPVRAAGEREARVEEASLPVAPSRPLGTERGKHAVADLGDEATLRDRDDPQRGQPRHVLRPAHPTVLDAMAMIRSGKRAQGVGVDVEDGGDRAVTDGVGGDLPARAVGTGDDVPEPRHVHLEEAAVAGLALEVATHRGGPPDQRAVGEDLHRPDAQPLVAPAGAQAQVEAEAVAVRGGVGQVVQGLRGDHERGPHPEAPLSPRLLPRRHLHRAPGHEAAAHAGLLHAREPLLEIALAGAADGVHEQGLGVGIDQRAREGLRLLLQEAGRPSGGVALHHAAFRHRHTIDADGREHAAAHHAHVSGVVLEPHQVVGRHRVQLVRARVPALGQLVLIVPAADHPRAGRLGRGAGPDRAQDVLYAADRRRGERQVAEREAERRHVVVRVVEAGDHRAALQAHHARRAQMPPQLVAVADRHDAVAQHRQRGGARARRVHGQERPALEDPVHAHAASSSRRHATPDRAAAL